MSAETEWGTPDKARVVGEWEGLDGEAMLTVYCDACPIKNDKRQTMAVTEGLLCDGGHDVTRQVIYQLRRHDTDPSSYHLDIL